MHMMLTRIKFLIALTLGLTSLRSFAADAAKISVNAAEPSHEIPRTLWGVFFEDINLSADGGIYPELVKNRSFEDSEKPESWKFTSHDGKSSASVVTPEQSANPPAAPLNPVNRRSLCVKADGAFTLENEGYWGMNIVQGDHYTLKLAARATDGFNAALTAKLVSADGKKVLASGKLNGFSNEWAYYTVELVSAESDS